MFEQLDLFAFAADQQKKIATISSSPTPVIQAEPPRTSIKRFILNDTTNIGNGKITRILQNLDAIKVLKKLGESTATESEKQILSKFTGWGGLDIIFDKSNNRNQELKSLLNEEEYSSAESSILDAFYTPDNIIRAMWDIWQKFGFKQGNCLEIGAGKGDFILWAPEKTKFTAIEIDPIAANIMKKLFPQENILAKSIANIELEQKYDLFIGNVPFGKTGVYNREYPNMNLHNYCIIRGIKALKDSGLAIILTSAATMDSNNNEARKIISSMAGLLMAIRLPKTTFKTTEVVTDILVFQKGKLGIPFTELKTVPTLDNTGEAIVNEYFAAHPEHVLGYISNTGTMYGKKNVQTVIENQISLADQLHMIIEMISPIANRRIETEHFFEQKEANISEKNLDFKSEYSDRDYTILGTKNGNLIQILDHHGKLLTDRQGKELTNKEKEKIHSYLCLREIVNTIIEMQLNAQADEITLENKRKELNNIYNIHLNKYGVLSNKLIHKNILEDPDYLKIAAIEDTKKNVIMNEKGIKTTKVSYEKGDIFFRRTQFPWCEPHHATSFENAGLISYAYRHCIDLDYIGKIMGTNSETAKAKILESNNFFLNPENCKIELASKYLSGNIRNKINIAQKNNLEKNVAALEKHIPEALTIEDIDFMLGSYWIPTDIVESWIQNEFQVMTNISYNKFNGQWKLKTDYLNKIMVKDYKVENLDMFDLIEHALNLNEPIIKEKIYIDGKDKYIVNKEATTTAVQFQNELKSKFKNYCLNNKDAYLRLEFIYNEKFNQIMPQQYSMPSFDVYPNAVSVINNQKFILREHQRRAVTRCIEGNTLLAHCVGAGKTAILVTTAMELKRLSLATKTLLVVQNATLEQYAEFAPKLYPNSHVLIATKNDLIKEKRKHFLGRIATGDWDLIVMAQSSFDMLENNPETVKQQFKIQIEELEKTISDLEGSSKKETQKQIRNLENKLKKLADQQRSENIVYFEELGIDCLMIDEAHEYKRNFFVTKMKAIKGLDRGASQKAFNLSIKIKHIMDKTNGRNIYFATGTPVTNTLAEIWNMIRYVCPNVLREYDCESFDEFASTFADTETALEIDAAGRFKMVKRFSKYMNIIEMSKMFRMCADIILPEDLKGVPRPPMKNGRPEQISIPRSQQITNFTRYLNDLYIWFEHLKNEEKRKNISIPLQIYGLARKSTIDMRLIHSNATDDPYSKLNICIQKVVEKYHEYESVKGTQIIFCDLYRNGTTFNVYEELKRKLVTNGISANEIAIINEYKTDKKRQEIFDQVNTGDIRIIIGSTRKLGTGVNIQTKLAVAHHIDAPFRPSDMEQRNGRIIRQGNTISEVEIIEYGVQQTLDAGMYQILTRKQKFINNAMKGEERHAKEINNVALDYATFSAQISGNKKIQRKVEIETRLRELHALELQFRKNIRDNNSLRIEYEKTIPKMEKAISHLEYMAKNPLNIETNNMVKFNDIRMTMQDLQQKITTAFYKAISDAKNTACSVNRREGELTIGKYKFMFFSYCPTDIRGIVEIQEAYVKYEIILDESLSKMDIKKGGRLHSGSGIGVSIKSLFESKLKELNKFQELLNIKRQKLKQLQNMTVPNNRYSDEILTLENELHQIIVQLDKESPEEKNTNVNMNKRPIVGEYMNFECTDSIIDENTSIIEENLENISEEDDESVA